MFSFLILFGNSLFAADPERIATISLEGNWNFSIGDQKEWASPSFNDSQWSKIRVPARWEDVGYQGYDGYAWYRLDVVVPTTMRNQILALHLGYIDDVDEVFVNGKKVGQTGSFPPNFETGYNAYRKYLLPNNLLTFGSKNVIAVRVYDAQLAGGLISGKFMIQGSGELPPFDIDLVGEWLFNKGRQYNESTAVPINVPGNWENQGFKDYDGYAVYTRKIRVSKALAGQRLVMLAGRIDDVDQFYINGQLIGQTGEYYSSYPQTMYKEFRNYFIPPGTLKADKENILEIRVLDTHADGGISEGPVGIITQNKFREYWKNKRVR